MKVLAIVLLLTIAVSTRVQSAQFCGIDTRQPGAKTGGIVKDFSPLKDLQLTTEESGYTYTMNLCSTSSQTCPDDPDGVTEGMATQTQVSVVSSRCYVLAQWDPTATWTNNNDVVKLQFGNGSPDDCPPPGLPRTFTATFACDPNVNINDMKDENFAKTSFQVKNTGCQYEFIIPTCIACDKGCGGSGGASTFFELFFIIFSITLSVYLVVGILVNIFHFKKNGKEAVPNILFWNYFFGLVMDGFAYTVALITCKTQQTSYDSFGGTSAGDSVYTNADTQNGTNPYEAAGNNNTL